MENVFHPSFGNRPDTIVGRSDVIDAFLAGLETKPGNRDRAMLILGQRGMGKTALLLELGDRAIERNFIVARVAAGETMLDEIVESVQIEGAKSLDGPKGKIGGFSAGAFGFSLGLTFTEEIRENYGFRTKLSLLCDRLAEKNRGVLILVDEAQKTSEQMRQLATTYQHLAGEGKNIAICLAGLPSAVSSVLNDDILTFLNRARKVRLGPLALGDIRNYYARTFSEANRDLTGSALDEAASATRGFPYLLQLIGYHLVRLSEPNEPISLEMVRSAVENSKEELIDDVFEATLRPLSRMDRQFLRALAENGPRSGIAEIGQRMGKPENYVQVYRTRLLEAGVIAEAGRGEVELVTPYLDEYLRD